MTESSPSNKKDKLNGFGFFFSLLEYTAKREIESSMVSWAGISFSYDLGQAQPVFLGEYINTGKRLV